MNIYQDGEDSEENITVSHDWTPWSQAATQFTCIDNSIEQIPGSGGSTDGYLFYTVEAHCGHFIPCSAGQRAHMCSVLQVVCVYMY